MSQICALCGRISFKNYHEYEVHKKDFHGFKSNARPLNVTGRITTQIVKEAEKGWLKPYLVPTGRESITTSSEVVHLPACRCNTCFQQALDKLVDESEKALQ